MGADKVIDGPIHYPSRRFIHALGVTCGWLLSSCATPLYNPGVRTESTVRGTRTVPTVSPAPSSSAPDIRVQHCVVSYYEPTGVYLYEDRLPYNDCAPCNDPKICRPVVVNLGTWDPVPLDPPANNNSGSN